MPKAHAPSMQWMWMAMAGWTWYSPIPVTVPHSGVPAAALRSPSSRASPVKNSSTGKIPLPSRDACQQWLPLQRPRPCPLWTRQGHCQRLTAAGSDLAGRLHFPRQTATPRDIASGTEIMPRSTKVEALRSHFSEIQSTSKIPMANPFVAKISL